MILEEKEFKVRSEVHEGIDQVEGREGGTFTKVIGQLSVRLSMVCLKIQKIPACLEHRE